MIIKAKTPLRIGFVGGGTDLLAYSSLYGGIVINATINKYSYCTIEDINDKIIFEATDLNIKEEYDLLANIPVGGPLKLLKGVYQKVINLYNEGKELSIRVSTCSSAPVGSGLGTSSTMVVCILKAFLKYLDIKLDKYKLAFLAYEIERIDLGLSGGRQDQFAASFGGINYILFNEDETVLVNKISLRDEFKKELEESIVLYYSGISRKSADIIDEQIKSVQENKTNLKAMHMVKKYTNEFMRELQDENIFGLAEVLNAGWLAKKETSQAISNNEVEDIYIKALKSGALGGKISGAGGGGFFIFLVEKEKKANLIKALKSFGGDVWQIKIVLKGALAWKTS